jgi:DNA segregation ATPase FtsK/SpoIIIE-like protein
MAKGPMYDHNGTGLSPEEQRKLWDHVRAREALNEQADEIRMDVAARKELIKADGFDVNMVEAILKRRKNGEGETRKADSLIRMYEDGLRDQGALPLEQTRAPVVPTRRPLEEIARELHGESLPDMPERPDVTEYARAKQIVVDTQKASVSALQRHLEIGYNNAARHMEQMQREGIVSRPDNVGMRTVLVGADPEPEQEREPEPPAPPPRPPTDTGMLDPF